MFIAVLDFGTNTFNLLIAEKKLHGFEILYSGKEGVKLGRSGIQKRIITGEAMERGFSAIEKHLETIRKYGAHEVYAFATSAIRSAVNGNEFVRKAEQRFGFSVQVINGDREAELIYKGVRQAVSFTANNTMILDIGGGSVEFIICKSDNLFWKHSFDIGMARVLEQFDLSDPVTDEDIESLERFFETELHLLFDMVNRFHPEMLIGASGTFDTLRSLIMHKKVLRDNDRPGIEITMQDYGMIHRELLLSTLEKRKVMPGMEPVRVEMIVPATIFVNFIIHSCGIKRLYQSSYALKEGVMAEMVELQN
ncbi:MAG TPA: phosphatase [Bacteroidaceae bacterium]|nr:phosphatase [Bacteroidaceae bacterium]